ncbi:FAM72 protein-domain-containing protein [Chytriomyces sp. MP71]|nr:FAM72 protein-domain-containing protein [Chytriomyces sp. MP71]
MVATRPSAARVISQSHSQTTRPSASSSQPPSLVNPTLQTSNPAPATPLATAQRNTTTRTTSINGSRPQFFSRSSESQSASVIDMIRALQEGAMDPPPRTSSSPSIHPQFRSKAVCMLFCGHCRELLCRRGMKAILLGNTKVELYSTDTPPSGVQLVFDDYMTPNCLCRIRDAACLGCGNVVGYHVTQPCARCLESCNNGHFWMFKSEEIYSTERSDGSSNKTLRWANVMSAAQDRAETDGATKQEQACR